MKNIRDFMMVGVVAVAAFGGSYFGATPKGQAEGQGQTTTAETTTDAQQEIEKETSGSFFKMPEVNDENCKPANIDKVSALHQKDFAEKCFKRGTVSSSSRDKAY